MPWWSVPDTGSVNGLALEVRDLVVRSPDDGRTLLDGVTFSLTASHFLCISGASGAGKSTLLFALAGLQPLHEGLLRWGETELATATPTERAHFRGDRVGLVFQDLSLFEELGPLDNAAMAGSWRPACERVVIRARAAELLLWLGLDPDDTRPVSMWSGGERQRVAVARALANDPSVILADEPTASLDRASANRLVQTLRSVADSGGRTLVVVSHDPAVIEAADSVLELVDGRVARFEQRRDQRRDQVHDLRRQQGSADA